MTDITPAPYAVRRPSADSAPRNPADRASMTIRSPMHGMSGEWEHGRVQPVRVGEQPMGRHPFEQGPHGQAGGIHEPARIHARRDRGPPVVFGGEAFAQARDLRVAGRVIPGHGVDVLVADRIVSPARVRVFAHARVYASRPDRRVQLRTGSGPAIPSPGTCPSGCGRGG